MDGTGRRIGRFDALLIDCDGVLVDSIEASVAAWRRWAAGLDLDPDAVVEATHGRRTAEAIARLVPADRVDAEATRFERIDLDLSDQVRPCPGAVRFVREIQRTSRWAVVTSANRSVAEKRLATARIGGPPVLVAAEDVTAGKPSPEGYLLAAERLGVDPRRCLAFDDLEIGFAAAAASGATAVLVGDSPGQRHHLSIKSLAEVDVVADGAGFVVRSRVE